MLFHQRLCGPLANSLFHHRPDAKVQPRSKLEDEAREKLLENVKIKRGGRRIRITFNRFRHKRGKTTRWFWTADSAEIVT